MSESQVYNMVRTYFSNLKDMESLQKTEGELNEEIKEKFGYDAQLRVEEVGDCYDTNLQSTFYAVGYLDEFGKLRMDKWIDDVDYSSSPSSSRFT